MIPSEKVYDILKNTLYGGKVEVIKKHAKVNSDQELILGLDFSNMYGHSQCLPLPYGEMKFESDRKKLDELCVKFNAVASTERNKPHLEKHSSKILHYNYLYGNECKNEVRDPYNFEGFLRCRLHYTYTQAQRLKDFLPLPEKKKINEKNYNAFMNEQKEKIENVSNTKKGTSTKIVFDAFDKENYCIHATFLKFLLENNMCKLDAIYEAIEMKHGFVMRDYKILDKSPRKC